MFFPLNLVRFQFLVTFGAREPLFFPNRFQYMPEVSVLLGDWLPCSFVVWALSRSVGALILAFYWHTFTYQFLFTIWFFLHCDPNRSGLCIYFSLFFLVNLSISSASSLCFSSSNIPTLLPFWKLAFYFLLHPVVPVFWVSISLYSLALMVGLPYLIVVGFVSWVTLFSILLVLFEHIYVLSI